MKDFSLSIAVPVWMLVTCDGYSLRTERRCKGATRRGQNQTIGTKGRLHTSAVALSTLEAHWATTAPLISTLLPPSGSSATAIVVDRLSSSSRWIYPPPPRVVTANGTPQLTTNTPQNTSPKSSALRILPHSIPDLPMSHGIRSRR